MKGLDALAKACAPAEDPTPAPSAALQLSDEQIDQIANRMLEKLQNQRPEPEAEKDDPAPEPEAPAESSGKEEEGDDT